MSQQTDTRGPVTDLPSFGDEDHSACPDCQHRREVVAEDWIDRLAAWWRARHPEKSRRARRLRAPECDWRAETMADTCGCTNSFHAS